ncbi:unnamed protein product [Peniophora sp. CBMAI 1063]|nr:unnamed protein product [Peniophora sp. CBMAI 1063]
MAQYSGMDIDSEDFWLARKEHPGSDAVRTAAMVATGLDSLSSEDEREALRVRRWRHNLQKVLLQTSPAVALAPEQARDVSGWLSQVEAYDKMTLYALNYSKLDKVLYRISLLEGSTKLRGDPYSISTRARALSERWQPSSLPRTLRDAQTARSPYFPPSIRTLHPTLSALNAQSHTSSLDLLAAVSTAERMATLTPQPPPPPPPPRRILVSSSAQTDDDISNGVNGTLSLIGERTRDTTASPVQNGTR